MRYIGIDYGKKRVGIAVSDENGEFGLPHSVLQNDRKILEKITEICEEKKVGEVVIGESRDFSGAENPVMGDIRKFAAELEKTVKLPIHFEPEFLTSAEAKRIIGENDMLDASAAALILKSYIDKIRSSNN